MARDEKVDAGVRRDAAQALWKLGRADEAVLKGLLALAEDEKVDAGVRYYAYQALKQLLG
jgi:HEAT repeat protein